MNPEHAANEHFNTVVIGGGQAGLSVGYHLKRRNIPFVILEANTRIGDSWRKRWDSLRLFTPARLNGIDGMRFPGPPFYFPTKDEMADYLEGYSKRFDFPVRTGVRVDRLTRGNGCFVLSSPHSTIEAENVVVAMATFQNPQVPAFARELNSDIVQLHSSEYRNPSQLRDGGTLVVGAGNSGAEIAMEIVKTHKTWMSGRDVGHVPFDIEGLPARLLLARLVLRLIFHRVLTVSTPIGRRVRSKLLTQGGPLIRQKPKDISSAGIERIPRVAGVREGKPLLEDHRSLDVANIVWCTGFHPGFSWIDLPVHGKDEPQHSRGIVETEPGLFFVGLHFLYSLSSAMIHGVGRDARYVAEAISLRSNTGTR